VVGCCSPDVHACTQARMESRKSWLVEHFLLSFLPFVQSACYSYEVFFFPVTFLSSSSSWLSGLGFLPSPSISHMRRVSLHRSETVLPSADHMPHPTETPVFPYAAVTFSAAVIPHHDTRKNTHFLVSALRASSPVLHNALIGTFVPLSHRLLSNANHHIFCERLDASAYAGLRKLIDT